MCIFDKVNASTVPIFRGAGLLFLVAALSLFMMVNATETAIERHEIGSVESSTQHPCPYRIRGRSSPVYLSESECFLVNQGFWTMLAAGAAAAFLLVIGSSQSGGTPPPLAP